MDRLEAMQLFVAVAEQGGFARAARKSGVSAVQVTRQIAALEEHLNARLFQRTTRNVTLTDAGQRYLLRARSILQDVLEAEAQARSERSIPQGLLSVTAPVVFGRMHVAPLMCRYLERYKKVRAKLHLADARQNLIEEGYDAAVRIGALDDSTLVARKLGATRRVLVAAPRYLKKSRKLKEPRDLAHHDTIQFVAVTPSEEWKFRKGEATTSVKTEPRFVTNSADAALGHAEMGGGVVVALSYQVAASVREGRLEVVLNDFEPPPLPIHIVYPAAKLLPAKVRALVDLLSEESNFHFTDL